MPIFVAWLLHYQSHVWLISPPRLRNCERTRLVSTAPPPMPALHTAAQPWTINPPKLNLKFGFKIKFWQRFACNGEHWSLSHTNLLKVRKSTKAILWPQFDQLLEKWIWKQSLRRWEIHQEMPHKSTLDTHCPSELFIVVAAADIMYINVKSGAHIKTGTGNPWLTCFWSCHQMYSRPVPLVTAGKILALRWIVQFYWCWDCLEVWCKQNCFKLNAIYIYRYCFICSVHCIFWALDLMELCLL